ncbi:SpoIIE family protein phosphatase [Streptomyces sp. NPDC047000]|uniref:PP2C family protein-serine/threonine phosphatase n=1 Tax=Streptomyces sp. NPDC047000 TaxID=3155474 RepID=UPI0033D4BFE0
MGNSSSNDEPIREHARRAVREAEETARQQAVERLGILDTPPEERFDRITRVARRLFGVPTAAVTLLDNARQWAKSHDGEGLTEVARTDSFCSVAVRQDDTFVVADALRDARFADNPLVRADPAVRFYAGHPLRTADGHRVGMLCVTDSRPREMSEDERRLLRDLAQWAENELAAEDDLRRAAAVQAQLLPRAALRTGGWEVAGSCVPARAVGGDFYDWSLHGTTLRLVVADVMGKGTGAALMAAGVRAAVRGAWGSGDVREVLTDVSRRILADLSETGTFVTVFHAAADLPTGRLTYADAGHGLAWTVAPDGTTIWLHAEGLPLGISADGGWSALPAHVPPGGWIVCVSDGFLDALDSSLTRCQETVPRVHTCATAEEAVALLAAQVSPAQATDDITLLVAHREAA